MIGFQSLKGVRLRHKKELSENVPVRPASLPDTVYLPLSQHRGAPAPVPVVQPGEHVLCGQIIARAEGENGVPLHATVSGIVRSLCDIPLPQGIPAPGIVIDADKADTWVALVPNSAWRESSVTVLLDALKAAGVVGLGGAAFPAHVKLRPVPRVAIDTVIINGCECEPYLTADYRLMIERAPAILDGAEVSLKISGASRCIIAIEKDRRAAIEAIEAAIKGRDRFKVKKLEPRYPQGAEKILIRSCTGRQLSMGKLPRDVGVVMHNVGSAVAIGEAVIFGKPLVERVLTVSGEGVRQPANLLVRIGTPVEEILMQCGGRSGNDTTVIAGGPMMGVALTTSELPVLKNTSGILVIPNANLPQESGYDPCIRCGRCAHACPRGHLPFMISQLVEQGDYEQAKEYELMDCLECGCCAFSCPSRRPVVDFLKHGKREANRKPAS